MRRASYPAPISIVLEDHRANTYSQFGEDGMIAKALEVIPNLKRWCVEIGAWDGVHDSNTHLLMGQGWSGVFIEAEAKRYRELQETYAGNGRATCVKAVVGLDGELGERLASTRLPADFDLLSIQDNSPRAIQTSRFQTRVYQLFDGTLRWDGCTQLQWHGVDLRRQALPRPVGTCLVTSPTGDRAGCVGCT